MRRGLRTLILVAASAAVAPAVFGLGAATAGDEAFVKDAESRYRKLTRNKAEIANRERRKILMSLFDHRDLKSCRKLLRDAYEEETLPDNRICVVQVLASAGEPKEIDFLLGAFKKERSPGPQIALGEALSYTDPAKSSAVAAHAAGLVAKQKGEIPRSLLEGVAALGEPSAMPALTALGDKLGRVEQFERLIALGACGRAGAREALVRSGVHPDPEIRLAVALGLGRTGGPGEPPAPEVLPDLVSMLGDTNPRVVEAAAEALAKTKHEPAVKPLAEAMRGGNFRTREELRNALRAITGRDAGHDADAWEKADGKAAPPKVPSFAGMPVPSDRVALLLDLSRSMEWNERFAKAQSVLLDVLPTLPEDSLLGVLAVGRTPVPMSERLGPGAGAKVQAEEWIRKQLTAGGFDLAEALDYVVNTWPSVDTVLLATDSEPTGDTAEDTPFEVMQEFRKTNRARRVRVFVAFVAPGGRYPAGEVDEGEYPDRKEILQIFAESTGGKFSAIE